MRRHNRPSLRHDGAGFSLIELMVSLALGLIITGAAFAAFLGTSSASKMAEAQGRMNEDAQAALTILTQQLRMAGNNPDQANRVDDPLPTLSSLRNPVYLPQPGYTGFAFSPASFTLSGFSIRGCDGQFSNLATAAGLDALICAPGASAGNVTDTIAVSYEADRFNTVPTESGLPTDCLGNALSFVTATLPTVVAPDIVSTEVSYAVADNRFYIDSSGSVPSLYCKGNGSARAQPLVDNIEDLQFTYGAVSTAGAVATAPTAGYLNANEVSTQATLAVLADDAARWARVITVRVCVLVRSESLVVTDLVSARYLKCDGTLEMAPADLRLRRAFSSTVVLRNRRL